MTTPNAFKAILAATDLSAPSRDAGDRAAHLARVMGAELTLLHVVSGSALDQIRQWMGLAPDAEHALVAQAAEELHRLAQSLSANHGVAIAEEIATGSVAAQVLEAARSSGAALIVVGARGGGGHLRRLTLGSTAERLLRRSTVPTLVVRGPAEAPYRRVLVPVDFSDWSDATLALVRQVAPLAHVILLHAWSVPFENTLRFADVDAAAIEQYRRVARADAEGRLRMLAQAHRLENGKWQPCLVQGDPWISILDQATEHDCDLVAMGKHGRHDAEELLLGSVTQRVLSESATDLLVATLRG